MSEQRFLLWGCGGHGRVVRDIVEANGAVVVACADRDASRARRFAEELSGQVAIFSEEELLDSPDGLTLPDDCNAVALAIGNPTVRRKAAERCGSLPLPPLVHPRATVSPQATVGAGSVVIAGAVVNAGAVLGRGVIVNTGATIGHDVIVSDFAHVAPGANLCGASRVGEGAWIGAGSVVIQGITIGDAATVGAGAVVVRDVPGNTVVLGNPARIHRKGGDGDE